MANKNVARAQKRVAKALSSFGAAHAQVLKAKELIETDINAVNEAIDQLTAERNEAETQLQKTVAVAAKLSEFVI